MMSRSITSVESMETQLAVLDSEEVDWPFRLASAKSFNFVRDASHYVVFFI